MTKDKLIEISLSVLQWATLIVLSFPVCLVYSFMHLVLLLQRIKLHCMTPRKVHHNHFHGGRMLEIDQLSTEEEQDFKKHRSSSYIKQLTFGSLWEFSKFVVGKQSVPLIEDDVIVDVIINSVFCHGLIKGEKGCDVTWTLPFNLNKYHVFDGFYWDVSEIRIHADNKLSIMDRSGEIHTPQSATWNLAKAHAQAQLTFFAPGLAHNHVHFVFPSLMASHVRTELPKTSLLRQLLEPHTRFTQYINYKALNECASSTNTGSFTDRWLKPWLSFPIDNDDFLNGIKENCEKFYYDNLTLTQDIDEDLPYHKFLKEHYAVVKKYVKKLEPFIKADFEKLTSSMTEYLPALKDRDVCDVITTLIWNCAVVHFSDHESYLQLFANKYGCMCIRTPLIGFSSEKEVNDETNMNPEPPEDTSFFAEQDIYRTRCFLNSFVRFNSNPGLDLTLSNTKYEFTNEVAMSSAKDFLKNLNKLHKKLKEENKAIIPLSKLVRTVCF